MGLLFYTICWCWFQRPCSLRHMSIATPLLGLWVRIPQRPWMFVSCECCVFVRQRYLHLVDYLSKRVLPSVVCPSVIAKPCNGRVWPEIRSQHHRGRGGEGMCWQIYWLYWIKKGDLLHMCTNFLNVLSPPSATNPPPQQSTKGHTSALAESTSNHQTEPHQLILGIEPDVSVLRSFSLTPHH
jgi:hypothetical protein